MRGSAFKILLILTPAFDPNAGGVQMSTWKMARHFIGQGYAVSVFSFSSDGHKSLEGCKLRCAQGSPDGLNPQNLGHMAEHLQEFQPDVVINQMPYEHEIGEVLLRNKRYLLLGCLRNTLFSVVGDLNGFIDRAFPRGVASMLRNPVGRQVLRALHRRRHAQELRRILDTYDHFVMFGPPNLEELRYFVPEFDEDRIRLIPNSIPEVAEVPPPKEKRLLWLGRVEYAQKRAELILAVWSSVAERLPEWHLDVVGEGPALAALRDRAENSALPRIEFHGRQVPDDFYRRAAIFFMTSAFEGFPNTLVEAQSYGSVPVVFDSYPVASWIVEDSVSGELVRPFEVGEMADRIVALAEDEDRRRIMAENALESARRFHIDNVGEIWQALFEAEAPKHLAVRCRPAAGG